MELISHWIENNPEYAGLIVFGITFVETFAFIGALVPGVVVLFAASALIGSNQSVDLWVLLVIAGTSTAISNGLSFMWGYRLRHRIENIPFLVRHKNVLDTSADFFDRWGPLSIMIGRFIGPIRPFVAFAAGTLSFSPKRFVMFDLLAIAVWSPVYIVPGYLAGMAVDSFIPSWNQWPPFLLLSLMSTAALVLFLAGNFWLQTHKPKAKRLAQRIGCDELPLASFLLLITTFVLHLGLTTPFPLDAALASGFQQILQPWGVVLSASAILLADPWLLSTQVAIICFALAFQKNYRAAALLFLISTSLLVPDLIGQNVSLQGSNQTLIFTALCGSATALFCESVSPSRRWFFYLIAILIIIVHSVALLALSIYSLSQIVQGAFYGIEITASIRIAYSFLRHRNFRFQTDNYYTFILLGLVTISYVYLQLAF